MSSDYRALLGREVPARGLTETRNQSNPVPLEVGVGERETGSCRRRLGLATKPCCRVRGATHVPIAYFTEFYRPPLTQPIDLICIAVMKLLFRLSRICELAADC